MRLKLVPLLVVTLTLLVSSAYAQSMAAAYFDQCTGQVAEKQARALFEGATCQTASSCEAFDPAAYAGPVIQKCFLTAMDICVVFDGPDACVSDINVALSERLHRMIAAFPADRVKHAAESLSDFRAAALMRSLQQRGADATVHCDLPAQFLSYKQLGLQQPTLCAALEGLTSLSVETSIIRRTMSAEAGKD